MVRLLLTFGLVFAMQQGCESSQKERPTANASVLTNEEHKPLASPTKERMIVDEKEELAKKVEKIDADTAAVIRSENSKLTTLPTPFYRSGKIYRVEKFAPTRPIIRYIGVGDDDFTTILNANEKGFFELADKAGISIEPREARAEYLKTFLETVVAGNKRLQIVGSVKEIKPRPNLDDAKNEELKQFYRKYEKTVVPVKCSDAMPSSCVVFAVKGQDLVRIDAKISFAGQVEMKVTILESNLLIPYAN
ncbi:MAG: hypothetical protein WBD22_07810 [Pyrinomonadaceae bacterium]